jgi:hypothetical protein
MYEVWTSDHGRKMAGPRFRLLSDAVRHLEAKRGVAAYSVLCPDGTWLRWSVDSRSLASGPGDGEYPRSPGG